MSQIRLAFGIPAYGGKVVAEHARMWLELGHTLACSETRFKFVHHEFVDVCGIQTARNLLIANAMVADATWLFMVDADTWVEGEEGAGFEILRMISEADRADAAMVGAPVIRRFNAEKQELPEVNAYRATEMNEIGMKLRPVMTPRSHPPQEWGQQFEVDAIGGACIAINLRKIGDAMFRFTEGPWGLSEDLNFCFQLKKQNAKILCDGRVQTAHLSRPFPLRLRPPRVE